MPSRRLLTPGPEGKPLWVCLYVQTFGHTWAARIVGDKEARPGPATVKGFVFLANTAAEAARRALASRAEGVAQR